MQLLWLKVLLIVTIWTMTECDITMVKSDGTQSTTTEQERSSTTSSTSSKPKIKPKIKPNTNKKMKLPHSQYNIMWVTPFEIFNLSTNNDYIIDPSINNIMSDYAISLYNKFINRLNDGTLTLNGMDDKASLNDKFFQLQQYLHRENKLHSKKSDILPKKEFNILKLQISNLVNSYLKRCGVDKEIIKNALNTININNEMEPNSDKRMFLWATMLSNGSYHAPHSHKDSIVSGVYFAKIPETSIEDDIGGHLVFGDPRGTGIYPFGLKYIHIPIEGQIVLFPGYLVHWVEPVKSNDWRISFAFNIPGDWEDLSDTSMFYNF